MITPNLRGVQLSGDEKVNTLRPGLWVIHRRHGHKATTDDQLLAWATVDELERTGSLALTSLLELGMGKATVSLWLSALLPKCVFFGVESYQNSYQLSMKNRQLNQLEGRLYPSFGDLRDSSCLSQVRAQHLEYLETTDARRDDEGFFKVIVGAPPFMPLGSGVMPKDPQRAAGRFELKGGVEDYMQAAAENLAQDGFAVILMDGLGCDRALRAADSVGLHVSRLLRVTPRPNSPATYTVLWLRKRSSSASDRVSYKDIEHLSLRGAEGDKWSSKYTNIRARLGLLPG